MDDELIVIDSSGNYLKYVGFKFAAQLCGEDIGRFITWGEDSTQKNLRILSRLLLYTDELVNDKNSVIVQIVFRYTHPSGETTTEVSSTEIMHLWKKIPAPEKTTQEFRFLGVKGNVILQTVDRESLQTLYENTPTVKMECREVGKWKEYDLGCDEISKTEVQHRGEAHMGNRTGRTQQCMGS